MTVLTESRQTTAAYIVSEAANIYRSREEITLVGTVALLAGTVLGRAATAAAVSVADGTNTGEGALTLASPAYAANVRNGDYSIVCIGGTYTVTKGAVVGTGNGVLTVASPAFAAGVKEGVYKVLFVEPETDLGSFVVEDPDGIVVGQGVVGAAFDGVVKFAIADGSTDFVAGSYFPLTVAAAVPAGGGVFSVTAPDGTALANATEGAAYTTEIKFQIDASGTDFAIGDSFTVTAVASEGVYKALDPDATDGAQTARALLYEGCTPTTAGIKATVTARDTEVQATMLTWPEGITATQKQAAIDALETHGIVQR